MTIFQYWLLFHFNALLPFCTLSYSLFHHLDITAEYAEPLLKSFSLLTRNFMYDYLLQQNRLVLRIVSLFQRNMQPVNNAEGVVQS